MARWYAALAYLAHGAGGTKTKSTRKALGVHGHRQLKVDICRLQGEYLIIYLSTHLNIPARDPKQRGGMGG